MTVNGTVAVRDEQAIAQQAATLAIRPGQEFWTDKQRAALSVLGIKNASNADLAVFMHYCQKTGLDPFSRQIYMICRREKQGDQWVDKQTIQVGIDGFRVIRDRVASRLGAVVEYEDTIWYDADGGEHAVWLSDSPPAACRVVVKKNGARFPAVLRTSSYAAVNKNGERVAQWRTQADHMIEKCCEAFALRRAFPHDLGGIYVEDELPPAEQVPPSFPQRVTAAEITGTAPADPTPVSAAGSAAASETTPPDVTVQPARPARTDDGPSRPQQAGKAALDKLQNLLGQLDLGTEEDVTALVHWVAGAQYTATRGEVKTMTDFLDDHMKQAGGDPAEACSAIWRQYHEAKAASGG
jgi:phage recombination protein Bet